MEDDSASLSTTIFNQFQVFHIRGDLSPKYRQLCRESTVDYVFNQDREGKGDDSGVAIVRVAPIPPDTSSMNSMISNKRAKSKYILACGARNAITMAPDECSYTFTWEIADPSQRKLSEVKPTVL